MPRDLYPTTWTAPTAGPWTAARRWGAAGLAALLVALWLGLAADRAGAAGGVTASISGDTLRVAGNTSDNRVALRLQPGVPTILQVDVADDGLPDFSFDRASFSIIDVSMGAGNDIAKIDDVNGVFTDTEWTWIIGDVGNDTLQGGSGAEIFIAGGGLDVVDGNGGDDAINLGEGNDTLLWHPADGSDTVEGEGGVDAVDMNGNAGPEVFDLSANGARLRLTRDVGAVALDVDGVENVRVHPGGSADMVSVHDLNATAVGDVSVDLANMPRGVTGDGAPDQVNVDGTNAADNVAVTAAGRQANVSGLPVAVHVTQGEPDNDRLTVFGSAGDDRFAVHPRVREAIAVLVDGGDNNDTATTTGTAGNDTFQTLANGTQVLVSDGAPSHFYDLAGVESLVLQGLGGNDQMGAVGNLAALITITFDGAGGADTLLGSNGADRILGGPGNDFIDGQQGNDNAALGDGNDTFQWDPGDGNDIVEGQLGIDTLAFHGSAGAETIEAFANGARLLFTRNVGSVVMDVDGVERLDVDALDNTDVVHIHDLAPTAVTDVNVDLAKFLAGNTGDGLADQVFVDGTNGVDSVKAAASAGQTHIDGLGVKVHVANGDKVLDAVTVLALEGDDKFAATPAAGSLMDVIFDGGLDRDTATSTGTLGIDTFAVVANGTRVAVTDGVANFYETAGTESLILRGLAGNDQMSAVGNLAALTAITFDGGGGADTILGTNGIDTILGGAGNDFVDGQQGNDVVSLGEGNDTFNWDPGDGSDVVEGQGGADLMTFNGSAGPETFEALANGSRLRFTRNVGSVVMDVDGIETVRLNALGSADQTVIRSLAATAVTRVVVDLAALGLADGAIDTVLVEGTNGVDAIDVDGSPGSAAVTGLAARVDILQPDALLDLLTIDTLGGADNVDSTGLAPGTIGLSVI